MISWSKKICKKCTNEVKDNYLPENPTDSKQILVRQNLVGNQQKKNYFFFNVLSYCKAQNKPCVLYYRFHIYILVMYLLEYIGHWEGLNYL